MGVIKVETFDVDVSAATGQTHILSNDVGSLDSAFVRRTTSIDKQSGRTNSTGNLNPNDACSAAFLSGTNEVSFRQNNANPQKLVGEVWRYTGAASGPDEFIVRGRYAITVTGTTASQAVAGMTNRDRCVPFFTGASNTATSVNDYDGATVSVYIDGSNNIQLERGNAIGTLVVYVTVVEFTGSNWSVGHVRSAAHDAVAELSLLNTASDGTSGATFDVGDWANAMLIEASLEADTAETGLSDNLGVWTTSTTNSAQFTHLQDGNSRNDGVSYAHVLVHPSMTINRDSNTNISEGNGTYSAAAGWPAGASTTESLDELSLEWFSDTSGVGTAHARGRLSAYINTINTITFWVHRSGNNVRADWGVVQLGGITGVIKVNLDNVDTDNVVTNAQTNVVISAPGGGLGALQGTGKVELVQLSDYTGTIISQTVVSWSDTSITIDITSGALADNFTFIFVTTDAGEVGQIAVQVGTPPQTYKEAIEALAVQPDHYWAFQNDYVDEVGTAIANNSSGGTPTFDATPIVKGDTHCLLIDGQTDYVSPADQTDMNTSTSATRRLMGGWIMLDRVSQTLSVVWEEGAQVNNYALLNGFGNSLIWQFADASGDYVQAYMDIKLTPNRPYHVLMDFNGSGFKGGICGCYLDGFYQSLTNGNPWELTTFPSHSGNISWGHETNEDLKVGDDRGVDATVIEFTSTVACRYAHWYSWENKGLTDEIIRVELFEKGALQDVTIGSDTEANMQLDMDAYAGTNRPDVPCAIEVGVCTDGDFALDLDNITFDDKASIQIRYMGSSILTLTANDTTELDLTKISTPYGGTVIVVVPALLTLSGLKNPSEVRVYEAGTLTEIVGQEDVTTGIFSASIQSANVDIVIHSLGFLNQRLNNVDMSGDVSLPIQQRVDRQYGNA